MPRAHHDRESLYSQLLIALPRYTPPAQRLALQLYRLLAAGQPVEPAHLAAALHWPGTSVKAALHQFTGRTRYDTAGRIVAFGGLSLQPTAHRFVVAARPLYAWCAWDTLFLPALLQQTAQVASTCPVTAMPIRLEVTPERVAYCEPATAVVSLAMPPASARADVVTSFCCHVWFFNDMTAGEAWAAQHHGAFLLPAAEAFALGQRKNALQFGLH